MSRDDGEVEDRDAESVAEAYADYFAQHSIDFEKDMNDLKQSLFPTSVN